MKQPKPNLLWPSTPEERALELKRREEAVELAFKTHSYFKWLGQDGVIEFLDFLLARGTDMGTADNPTGEPLLHYAHAVQKARALRAVLESYRPSK